MEGRRVKFIKNKLILGQIYFTLLYSTPLNLKRKIKIHFILDS